jgi:hypothetical protein
VVTSWWLELLAVQLVVQEYILGHLLGYQANILELVVVEEEVGVEFYLE